MVLEPPQTLPDPPAAYDTALSSDEDDLYSQLKSLQRQIEFIEMQEEYARRPRSQKVIGFVRFRSEEATKISGFLTPLRSCYDVKIRYDSVTGP